APTQANSHSSTDILLIENDGNIVAAMGALFEQWGIKLRHGDSIENICKGPQPHIILADYHLDNNENGLQWLRQLQQHWGRKLTAIIISADRTDEVKRQAQSNGYYYLKKPVKPAALRALIDKLSRSL
ncbi:MAG: response regulator, partial [Cellvibrionaceae bacterium]|nr:response regulator [Cellvibrionaceae bacterium]